MTFPRVAKTVATAGYGNAMTKMKELGAVIGPDPAVFAAVDLQLRLATLSPLASAAIESLSPNS